MSEKPLLVGISGASGIVYGIRLLEALRRLGVESHLVMSKSAEVTLGLETNHKLAEVHALASRVFPVGNIAAPPASGSARYRGMIIAPCSVRTMSEIASGTTSSLLTRAADVTLKERRRLVLMVRETPLHTGHLRTMTALSEIGAIIAPPVPAFYAAPASLEEMVDQTVARLLELFDIEDDRMARWDGTARRRPGRRLSAEPA